MNSEVILEFQHPEIVAKSVENIDGDKAQDLLLPLFDDVHLQVPPVDFEAISHDEAKRHADEVAFHASTQAIHDEKRFRAFTPESEQVLTAELQLMKQLHIDTLISGVNRWPMVEHAWKSNLLPVGSLIHVKQNKIYLFVLKTNNVAALCWPATCVRDNIWRKARGIKKLTWLTIFSFDEVEVLPTEYTSLARSQFEDAFLFLE